MKPAAQDAAEPSTQWEVELYEESTGKVPFDDWLDKEAEYTQAVVQAAIDEILIPMGLDICSSEWGTALGDGLAEFRIRRSLHAIRTHGQSDPPTAAPGEDQEVLIRIFLAFYGNKIVLLFHGYNKKKDPSERRQQREIKRARKRLKKWKSEMKIEKKNEKKTR